MKMDNVSVKVKIEITYVIEEKKSNLVSLVEPTQFEKCVMMQEKKYVSNIEKFYFIWPPIFSVISNGHAIALY